MTALRKYSGFCHRQRFAGGPGLNEDEIARRKNMIHVQGKYNQTVLVSEFWGEVLSPQGEILLPRPGIPSLGIR